MTLFPTFTSEINKKQPKEETGTPDSGEQVPLQDSSSMENLTEGILSDEIVASTRRPPSKILFDIESEGVIIHPSGFVVPTPAPYTARPERKPRERDLAQQTAAVAERVSEQDLADVTAATSSRKGKVPYEVRQPDGTVVPPRIRAPDRRGRVQAQRQLHDGLAYRAAAIGSRQTRLPHHGSVARAPKMQLDFNPVSSKQQLAEAFEPRDVYMPTLATEPLWRPLITLTHRPPVPRRHRQPRQEVPRLVRQSYALDADDAHPEPRRRDGADSRWHARRRDRDPVQTESLGRGIGGEGLADPIPHQKRVIGVGLGNWYRLADEAKELFRTRAAEEIPAPGPFEIYDLDDSRNRLSETGEVVPWTPRGETIADKRQRQAWHREYRMLRTALRHLQTTQGPTSRIKRARSSFRRRRAARAPPRSKSKLLRSTLRLRRTRWTRISRRLMPLARPSLTPRRR
ncbi:hypothetical protein C8R47DRAFT_724978 [Mycena vitilis]|nr:hypothetical protein C8R47DRAFT_724978 [Mycena vitilis]